MDSSAPWSLYGTKVSPHEDIKSGYVGPAQAELRWGFIRKVYGILAFQVLLIFLATSVVVWNRPDTVYIVSYPGEQMLSQKQVYGILASQVLLTFLAASVIVWNRPVTLYIVSDPGLILASAVLPFVLLCALYAYCQRHPWNLVLLALFSLSFSVTLGLSCAFMPAAIVTEALFLTALITASLTAYTFYGAKRGEDFVFLGPATLFSGLLALVGISVVQLFYPLGSFGSALVAGGGALLFSLYIVYDNIISRYTYDDYIWASLALYLDIINLFTYLLEILSSLQGKE